MKISNESILQIFCAYITGRPIIDHGQLIDEVVQLVLDYRQAVLMLNGELSGETE